MVEMTKEEMLKEVDYLLDELKGVEKQVPPFEELLETLRYGLTQIERSHEHGKVYSNTMISTLMGGAGQQEIRIKKLEDRIKEIEASWQEGWDLAETYVNRIADLEEELRGKDGKTTKE